MEKTKRMYVVNAFSINMLKEFPLKVEIEKFGDSDTMIKVAKEKPITIKELVTGFVKSGKAESCIGHKATADILGLPFNRATVELKSGDYLFLAQYIGERLPEGTTVLPEGSKIEWFGIIIG